VTAKLTPEEEAFVKEARRLAEERAKLRDQGKLKPITTNPDKFNAPIGMDDEGNLFPDKRDGAHTDSQQTDTTKPTRRR
jgi:hypothetical protein